MNGRKTEEVGFDLELAMKRPYAAFLWRNNNAVERDESREDAMKTNDRSNVGQGTRKVLSVTETQTDLSLIHISERLSAYLAELGVTVGDDDLTNDKEVCYL
uniref:Protein FAR1-RELATED SEQUENCE n=1 Tax=Ascaris lumbricoides TaxID=6252 RepID=A0A0M3I3T0_ASCLU